MKRVAFTKVGGASWQGGHNYLVNLLRFLTLYQSGEIRPVLFVDPQIEEHELSDYSSIGGLEIIRSGAFSENRTASSLIAAIFLGRDRKITEALRQNGIDVVFESARYFGWRIGIPAIAWFPDLQHRDLPELFGRWTWWRRELGFRIQVMTGRTIMVSSFDAKAACDRSYRTMENQVQVVSFAVPKIAPSMSADEIRLDSEYGIATPFFFMPNQLWKHKNHQLVVEALDILKHRGIGDVVVVATGNTNDPRNRDHYDQLREEIDSRGLSGNYRILGMIPYSHVRVLLSKCKALLNPSLYEGWSTTVEEARSIGAPMILSDLPVHIEQAGDDAVFFDRYSPTALAEAIASFRLERTRTDDELEAFANSRSRQFAAAFAELVRNACARHE